MSNPVNRQTDRQTDRQTEVKTEYRYGIVEFNVWAVMCISHSVM